MNQQMVLHCGGKEVTLDELRAVELPQETKTYKPVGHYDLVCSIQQVAGEMLSGHQFRKGDYALAKDGQRMFGILGYESDVDDMGLSIAFRNSYDKSCAVGLAVGSSVFVCDNMSLTGEITVLRRHTAHVIEDLEMAILRLVYKSKSNFISIVKSAEKMRAVSLSDDQAFEQLGLLFGRGILTPRQLPVVKREWLQPSHVTFMPRDQWSLYNAVTTALKSTPPQNILERHISLHQVVTERLDGD